MRSPAQKVNFMENGLNQPIIKSYMLRFWQEVGGGDPIWRFALVDPNTGQRWGFTDLEQLTAFISQQTETTPEPGGNTP
jgi:hypothetical protein